MNSHTFAVNPFNPAIFECSATGIPPPTISWSRDGILLNTAFDPRIVLSDHSDPVAFPTDGGDIYSVTRTLTISDTMEDDSGTYTCLADNGNAVEPSVTQDFELSFTGKIHATNMHARTSLHNAPAFISSTNLWSPTVAAPIIIGPPQDLIITRPSDAVFVCNATAMPDLTWWRVHEDGTLVQLTEMEGMYIIDNEELGMDGVRMSTLTIVDVQFSDNGEYVCRATNAAGTNEASATLQIRGK